MVASLPHSPLEFLQRANAGEFGNTFKMWERLEDVVKEEYRGKLWIPSRTPGKPPLSLSASPTQTLRLNVDLSPYYFVQLPPPSTSRLFQFRLGATPLWTLDYTFGQLPLRHYVKEGGFRHEASFAAWFVLKCYLDPEDFEDLWQLSQLYRGNLIVEGTMWNGSVGRLGRRLCLWEVREY